MHFPRGLSFLSKGENVLPAEKLKQVIRIIKQGTIRFPVIHKLKDYTANKYIYILLKTFALPFAAFRYFFPVKIPQNNGRGLAVVLIAKNEAPYIEEWINFHVRQGVTHFIIYDNESTDNFHEILKPYIDSGLVTYHVIKGKCRQNDAYNMAVHDYGQKFRYMAFIDADEFLFLREDTDGGNICAFMDRFMSGHPNAGGIAVNWCNFGSGGHITKPEGSVLRNYTMRADDSFKQNHNVKTVCDPRKVFYYGYCHAPTYYRGFYNLDENGDIVSGAFTDKVNSKKIRINHYFCKSKEEYIEKMKRGRADISQIRDMEDFKFFDRNDKADTEILSRI